MELSNKARDGDVSDTSITISIVYSFSLISVAGLKGTGIVSNEQIFLDPFKRLYKLVGPSVRHAFWGSGQSGRYGEYPTFNR